MELQALIGRMLPTDINCQVHYRHDDDSLHVDIANWCSSVEAAIIPVEHLDQTEAFMTRSLKAPLDRAVKGLRSAQTRNRAGAH